MERLGTTTRNIRNWDGNWSYIFDITRHIIISSAQSKPRQKAKSMLKDVCGLSKTYFTTFYKHFVNYVNYSTPDYQDQHNNGKKKYYFAECGAVHS
jgi:hypothetical protein